MENSHDWKNFLSLAVIRGVRLLCRSSGLLLQIKSFVMGSATDGHHWRKPLPWPATGCDGKVSEMCRRPHSGSMTINQTTTHYQELRTMDTSTRNIKSTGHGYLVYRVCSNTAPATLQPGGENVHVPPWHPAMTPGHQQHLM
eukprot:2909770-Prorocentrum_lima.AAC.1